MRQKYVKCNFPVHLRHFVKNKDSFLSLNFNLRFKCLFSQIAKLTTKRLPQSMIIYQNIYGRIYA